jgi:hypothetical protein
MLGLNSTFICPLITSDFTFTIVECMSSACRLFSNIVKHQNAPPFIHVLPGQGDMSDVPTFTDPIPVLPGSRLFAYMAWTSRQIIPRSSSLFLTPFNVSMVHRSSLRPRTVVFLAMAISAQHGSQHTVEYQ